MASGEMVKLVVPALILACGAALLSHRFFAVYRGWSLGDFASRPHLPGLLGVALMLIAVVFAWSVGWPYVIVAVLGGSAIAHLYVYVFRMRVEAALLGPVLAVMWIFLVPTRFWA